MLVSVGAWRSCFEPCPEVIMSHLSHRFHHVHLAQSVPHAWSDIAAGAAVLQVDWMSLDFGAVSTDGCQGFQRDWGAKHQVRLFKLSVATDSDWRTIATGEQSRPWSVPGWMSSICSFSYALRARFFHVFFSMMQRMTELISHIKHIWAVSWISVGWIAYCILLYCTVIYCV